MDFRKRLTYGNILFAVLACLLWSTAFVGVKVGLRYAKPLSFAGIRFMISGLLLIPFTGGFHRYYKTVRINFRAIIKVAILQTFIVYALFYTGMTIVSGALAAIVIGSNPLITAIVAHYHMDGDRMTVPKTLSILLGILGIVIIGISRRPWSISGLPEFFGVIILLLSTTSGAFGNVTVAKDKRNIHPIIFNSAQIFLGGLFLLLISLPLEGLPHFDQPSEYYVALAWLSMLSAAAFSIWFTLLKKPNIKVSSLNLWKFIIPVFGALWSWLLLPNEHPEIFTVTGMICVALSIVSYNICMIRQSCD